MACGVDLLGDQRPWAAMDRVQRLKDQGLGFRVEGLEFRVQGLVCWGLGFWAEGF